MVLSSEKNLYQILEITSAASSVTIKSAYRKLARRYHPDLNGGDSYCIKKFKEITEAYEILSDAEKKKNYDLLRGFYKETSQSKYTSAQKAYRETTEKTREKSQKQKEDGFSNIFNDILEGFKKTTSSTKEFKTKQVIPERGSDIFTDVSITVQESIDGTTRLVNILHTETCPNCQGRTFLNGSKCPVCDGMGEKSSHKKLSVKIPPNIKHGSKIRIANEGNLGYNGGKNGDLYLNIKVESLNKFTYEGSNILCTVPITPFEAVLGANIEVETPKGKVNMKITPNTHSGQKFRLANQGLDKNGQKGDMIVTVTIEVPKNPSKDEIELYEKLKKITKHNIRDN